MEKRVCPICGDIVLLRICERCGHEIPDVSKQDLPEKKPINLPKSKQKEFLTQEERYKIIKAKAKKISEQKKVSTQEERYKNIKSKVKSKPKQKPKPQSPIENPSKIQEVSIHKTNYFPQLEVVKDKHQRIRELEKKTENLSNWICCTCFLFFPIGIILFILYTTQLSELDRLKKEVQNLNGYGFKNNVYFIQNILTRRIKIGMAHNVSKRLKQLQTGSDGELKIVGIIENKRSELEKELHYKFRKDHISGEWFNPSERLIGYINSINNTQQNINSTRNRNTPEETKLSIKKIMVTWLTFWVLSAFILLMLFVQFFESNLKYNILFLGICLFLTTLFTYLWYKKKNTKNNAKNTYFENPTTNLGWKTFGMWFLFYSIGVLTVSVIAMILGLKDIFNIPQIKLSNYLIMSISIVLALIWYKKHSVQV